MRKQRWGGQERKGDDSADRRDEVGRGGNTAPIGTLAGHDGFPGRNAVTPKTGKRRRARASDDSQGRIVVRCGQMADGKWVVTRIGRKSCFVRESMGKKRRWNLTSSFQCYHDGCPSSGRSVRAPVAREFGRGKELHQEKRGAPHLSPPIGPATEAPKSRPLTNEKPPRSNDRRRLTSLSNRQRLFSALQQPQPTT